MAEEEKKEEAAAPKYEAMDFPEKRRGELKEAFEKAEKNDKGRIELRAAHKLMFNAEERGEYGFDTFDEDLQATNKDCKDDMSFEDIIKFLDDNL